MTKNHLKFGINEPHVKIFDIPIAVKIIYWKYLQNRMKNIKKH